jgi:multicomponent Na+:H+ antiporter subunit D
LSWYLVAPVAIPMMTAVVCILLWNRVELQRVVSAVGAGAHLAVALLLMARVWQGGILAGQMGDWPAPFGITLVADHLSAVMVLITGIMGFGVGLYSLRDVDENRERSGFHPLYHVLLTGVTGSFITGDLFNLYVWFEVMLISSFALHSIAFGPAALRQLLKFDPKSIAGTGLLCALAAGLSSAVLGDAVLKAEWLHWGVGENAFHVGSPLVFDLGVFLVVIGAVLTIVLALEEEDV